MTDDSVPPKAAASFDKLRTAAGQLNLVSNRLGVFILALDQALQALNLGIEAWVPTFYDDDPVTGNFENRLLGYARTRAKWGIVLRIRVGNNHQDPDGTVEEFPFNEAPRALRIEAVDHLSELIEKLVSEATSTAERISSKVEKAQELVSAITMKPVPPRVQTVQQAAFASTPTSAQQAEALQSLDKATGALQGAEAQEALRSLDKAVTSAQQAAALRSVPKPRK